MRKFDTTLLFIIKDDEILLSEKKRGFATGIINGVGGKVEKGESIEEGLKRETQEEIGVKLTSFEKMAVINCDAYYKGERAMEIMHIFIGHDFEGNISESDEVRPFWCKISEIPFNRMFEGDRKWLPHLLSGRKFIGDLTFDEEFNLTDYKINFVDKI